MIAYAPAPGGASVAVALRVHHGGNARHAPRLQQAASSALLLWGSDFGTSKNVCVPGLRFSISPFLRDNEQGGHRGRVFAHVWWAAITASPTGAVGTVCSIVFDCANPFLCADPVPALRGLVRGGVAASRQPAGAPLPTPPLNASHCRRLPHGRRWVPGRQGETPASGVRGSVFGQPRADVRMRCRGIGPPEPCRACRAAAGTAAHTNLHTRINSRSTRPPPRGAASLYCSIAAPHAGIDTRHGGIL